jgi:putative protease
MSEQKVGEVIKFFVKPMVAAIKVVAGSIAVGDTLHFAGHTTDFDAVVSSMQEEHNSIDSAGPGQMVGIQVPERCRPGDEVLKEA